MSNGGNTIQAPYLGSDYFNDRTVQHIIGHEYAVIEDKNYSIIKKITGVQEPFITGLAHKVEAIQTINPDELYYHQLYLRPDTTALLESRGADPRTSFIYGDPYRVYGNMPERTLKMVGKLIDFIGGVLNKKSSTKNNQVWSGQYSGNGINLVLQQSDPYDFKVDPSTKIHLSHLALRAYKVK